MKFGDRVRVNEGVNGYGIEQGVVETITDRVVWVRGDKWHNKDTVLPFTVEELTIIEEALHE